MWPSEKMKFSPYVIISILLLVFLTDIKCEISDKRLCGDPECLEPVATGRTIIDYHSSGSGVLSFKKNTKVLITSKSAGTRPDLWGVQIDGRMGYVPKNFIREDKILKRKLEYVVSTSMENEAEIKNTTEKSSDIVASSEPTVEILTKATEVLEGNPKEVVQSSEVIVTDLKPDATNAKYEVPEEALTKATEFLKDNPKEVVQSSETIVKDIKPDATNVNYEVIGDTTIYYSAANDKLDDTKQEPSNKEKQTDINNAENITVTTSVSVSESIEINANNINVKEDNTEVPANAPNTGSDVYNKELPIGSEVPVTEISIENPTNENSPSEILNISSENLNDDAKGTTDIKPNLIENKLNLKLDSLDKLDVNVDIADSLNLLDQKNIEVHKLPVINNLQTEQNYNTEPSLIKLQENQILEKPITANYLFNKNTVIKNNEASKNVEITNKEEGNKKLVKRDAAEEIENIDIDSAKLEINNEALNSDISVLNNDNKPKSLMPDTENLVTNSKIMKEHEANVIFDAPVLADIPILGSDLPIKNFDTLYFNTEANAQNIVPVLNNEKPQIPHMPKNSDALNFNTHTNIESIDSVVPATETDKPEATISNTFTTESILSELLNHEQNPLHTKITPTTEPTVKSEESILNHEQNSLHTKITPNTEPTVKSEEVQVDEHIVSNPVPPLANFEDLIQKPLAMEKLIAKDDFLPSFKKMPDDILSENANAINEPQIDPKDSAGEGKLPVGSVEEVHYGNMDSESNVPLEKEPVEQEPIDESSIYKWLIDSYSSIFGYSVQNEIEENLNELDNRHNGLLSRAPHGGDICRDPKSGCYASEIFTQPKDASTDESFTDSVIRDIAMNSGTTFVYLCVTAITVLAFTLGHYYIETWRQDGSLLRKVNTLEQALMVSTKECEILKEDLGATQTKLTSIKEGAFGSNEEVIALQEDNKKLEMTIVEKEKQIVDLQKEFEAATETGLELNKMLHDMMLTAQKGDNIAESMEQAQLQLNEQKETINSMSSALSARSRENSALQIKLKEYETQIQNITKLLEDEKVSNQTLQEERNKLREQVESLNVQLAKFKEENSYEIQQVRSTLSETQRDLHAKSSQVQLLEDCVKNLKSGNTVDIADLANVAKLQSDLQRITDELKILRESNTQYTDANKKLEDYVKSLEIQMTNLRDEHHEAEKDKTEAQTRLEVLSGYFKEKETQLQKELGIQEALWQQKQGEATSTVERLHSMQDEIQSLKSQNQSLRTEIEQQAAAHRTQVTALESRVHEAWLNSRQTQRKLEESRQEASTLRRKLTSMVEQDSMQKRGSSPLEVQLSAASPIHMNSAVSPILPPPLPFLPPPFLPPPIGTHPPPPPHFMPPFMGDMRPPPLGRLPSPPRQRRGHYSPSMASERYSPESRAYSPESRAYSPDSRAYSPDYRRPLSPYDTETDISPPASPYRSKYNQYASRRDEPRRLSKGVNSADSTETINRNGRNHTAKAV